MHYPARRAGSPLPDHRRADDPAVDAVGTFVAELAKKLAERWVALLLIPGALFTATTWVGVRLGQRHALDYSGLDRVVSDSASMIARQSAGSQAVVVGAVLLAAIDTGLAVQALAGLTRLLWLAPGPDY